MSAKLNGWNLFWVITIPISLVVVLTMASADLSSGEAVSSLIQLTVRFSVPWLYLAFAASSLHAIFSGMYPSIKAARLGPVRSIGFKR